MESEKKFPFETKFLREDEEIYISNEGLEKLKQIYDPNEPLKHILWTDDMSVELPIRIKNSGPCSRKPITLITAF